MQQQTASVSAQTATVVKNYYYSLPGGNTCLYKGGFLIITFGANYNIDNRLHNSHYSNIIMAPIIHKKKQTKKNIKININININLNVNMTSHSPLLKSLLQIYYYLLSDSNLLCNCWVSLILIIWMLFLTFYFPTRFSFTVKHFVAPCNVNQVIITLIILDRFLFKPWSVHPCLILSAFSLLPICSLIISANTLYTPHTSLLCVASSNHYPPIPFLFLFSFTLPSTHTHTHTSFSLSLSLPLTVTHSPPFCPAVTTRGRLWPAGWATVQTQPHYIR